MYNARHGVGRPLCYVKRVPHPIQGMYFMSDHDRNSYALNEFDTKRAVMAFIHFMKKF